MAPTPGETPSSTATNANDDSKLRALLDKYLTEEKARAFSSSRVSAFIREQRAQLALPPPQRTWARARQLYLALFAIDNGAQLAAIEGRRFAGGWTGSGSLYALTAQPMALAASLPTAYLASVPQRELAAHLTHYARVALLAQVCVALATPLVNAALQIVMVTRQQLMRSPGRPVRGRAMKAPEYDETREQLRLVVGQMVELEREVAGREREWLVAQHAGGGSQDERARLRQAVVADEARMAQLAVRLAELKGQVRVRREILDINYKSQLRSSTTRAGRSLVTLMGQVVSTAMHQPKTGANVQLAGATVAMALQQFWSAPADQFNKWDRTLQLNLESARLVKAGPSGPLPDGEWEMEGDTTLVVADEWTSDQLDLDDLRAQWKGPIGVHLALHQECLETELLVCQQRMAEHRQRKAKQDQAHRSRKPAATASQKGRWLALEVRIAELEADIACLQEDRWLDLSQNGKARLLEAIEGQKPWTLSLRTAWARLRQPPELIAQVAQRIGSQFAMFVAGSNMQLIVSNTIRFVNARRAEQGLPPAVARGELYALNVFITLLNVAMAFASGAAVSFKIRQRTDLRKKIGRVEFRWEEVPRGLWAILKAMFAVPRAVVERARVEKTAARGSALASELALRIAVLKGAVEQWRNEADGAVEPVPR